jgi:hypothetical protein
MNETAIFQLLDELGIDTSEKFVFVEHPDPTDPEDNTEIYVVVGDKETGETQLIEAFPFTTPEKVILETVRERLQD